MPGPDLCWKISYSVSLTMTIICDLTISACLVHFLNRMRTGFRTWVYSLAICHCSNNLFWKKNVCLYILRSENVINRLIYFRSAYANDLLQCTHGWTQHGQWTLNKHHCNLCTCGCEQQLLNGVTWTIPWKRSSAIVLHWFFWQSSLHWCVFWQICDWLDADGRNTSLHPDQCQMCVVGTRFLPLLKIYLSSLCQFDAGRYKWY